MRSHLDDTTDRQRHDAGASAVERARSEFRPETCYLDTATMGLPPERTLGAVRSAMEQWSAGRSEAAGFDAAVDAARASYARMVGVEAAMVAVGSQVSAFAGLVAASLSPGSEVLTASGDFTSILFPFMAQAARGVTVREVPLEELPGALTRRTALVSVSAVQSADGRLVDLDGLAESATEAGVPVFLDLTQAAGWLPVDAGRFAFTVAAGYKWLLAPRGTAYMTVAPHQLDHLVPLTASWYGGEDRWSSIYGGPLRLASTARRFDVSPAWHAWAGAAPSLELLEEVGVGELHRHATRLANRFRTAVGLPEAGSAIVSLAVDASAPRALEEAGVVASTRAGRLRLAFHVFNGDGDVDTAAAALEGHVLL